MKFENPPARPVSSGASIADGPTVWSACLALLWCAFLLLACAMATRFDEKRMVQSTDPGRIDRSRQAGSGRQAGSTEASAGAAGTLAPRHAADMVVGRPIE